MHDSTARTITITRAGLIGTIIVLVVAAACVRLGLWQLDRLRQRQERNRLLVQRMEAAPTPLTRVPRDTTELLYHRVELAGQLDHDHTIVLAGRTQRGAPGVHVLTPVLVGAGQPAVLLNRGWMPAPDAATVNFDSLRVSVRVTGNALVMRLPARQGQAPDAAVAPASRQPSFRRVWFTIDPEALRAQFPYRLADFQLQLMPDASIKGPPYPLPLPATDNGPHLGYAIQWFSFALIAIFGWCAIALKKGEIRRAGAIEQERDQGFAP